MPQISSRYFGAFELEESDVIHFPAGLPGLEDQTDYAAISIAHQRPILYLQSVTRPDLCLITLPALTLEPSYRLELAPEEMESLGLSPEVAVEIGHEVACQVIVTVDQDQQPAANLAAPLIINLANRRALQTFQNDARYSFRQPLGPAPQPLAC